MKQLFLLLFACFSACSLPGQYQIGLVPRESPDKGVYEKVAFTSINIRYGSPAVKGRVIWGALAPYNQVWRAGANNATTIEFSEAVEIDGQILAAGKYAFFIIPRQEGTWTLIFNKNANQWGAFSYQQEEDALRIEVAPQKAAFEEDLFYQIRSEGFTKAWIDLRWEQVKISLEVNTNYLTTFKTMVEERAQASAPEIQWVCYLQGAEFLIKRKEDLEQANTWLTTSQHLMNKHENWNKQYYPKDYIKGHLFWLLAQVSAAKEAYQEAIDWASKMQALNSTYNYYQKKKEAEDIDQQIQAWRGKLSKK